MSRTRRRLEKIASTVRETSRGSSQELELLEMVGQGHFGEQAQAALAGIKEASADLKSYNGVQKTEKVSSISDLYVDPEESRNQRLNTLLRRY